jgi:hypothetical protein
MEQSKQAKEMIELTKLLDKVNLNEVTYPSSNMAGKAGLPEMGPFGKPYAAGPGSSNRKTPNDYTQDEVVKMLDYTKKFVQKNANQIQSWKYGQQWLNSIGSGMKEFMTLRKGDPGLEYQEHKPQGDQHSEKYSKISFKHAAKGGAHQDMKGKSQGDTTNRSKEFEVDISKKKSQGIGFGKSEKGKGTSGYMK